MIRIQPIRKDYFSARLIGISLVLISALVFSSAGIFTKSVAANAWAVIFWRGLFAVGFTTLYIAGRRSLNREFAGMGRSGLMAAVVSAVATAAFISAFKLTSVANVSLIYAAAPFVAALIAWAWMRERPSLLVLSASLAAFAGVGLIVRGSLNKFNLAGDMLAIGMTLLMAWIINIYRRYPGTPGAGPMALSSVFLLPVALVCGDPLSVQAKEIWVLASFGAVFAVASITLVVGARHLPAAETALISSLEAPFAILLAWMLLAESPGSNTLIGGGIILAAVFGAQWLARERYACDGG